MTRSLRISFKHIRRSPYQAIAAALVLTTTFFLISTFSLVTAGSEKIIRFFESRPQVTAFFKSDAQSESVSELEKKVKTINGVTSTNFVSQEQALEIYREQNKKDPLLLEMVTADILPASLEVSVSGPEIIPQIADIMNSHEGVEDVIYQKDIIETLISWTRTIRYGGLFLISILLLSSVITIIIIISLKINTHKNEIKVMRLLGASKIHVVSPFLFEGILYGTAGSFVGWGVSYISLLYATPLVIKFIGSIPLLPVPAWFMLSLLGTQLLFGIFIGLISSLLAARRFLK